jgi:hypothetical protein
MSMHTYRGFEIHPLIYPHLTAEDGRSHNYEAGFDAAVRICLRGTDTSLTQSRTFKLVNGSPFRNAGDARRASLQYAEVIIDTHVGDHLVLCEADCQQMTRVWTWRKRRRFKMRVEHSLDDPT